ncbi:MAG: helix-turn-helix domain-containing protein [Cyclobacteriaceae bacterium]|nr:helix-turn-helix domain-containing protein [Cyclobacteriaceae bacterium]
MGVFFIIGIVQAFFIEFILLNKKNKSLPDKILATWMFFIGLHLFFYYLYYIGYHFQFPYIMGVSVPLPLIHGPFLLLYTVSLIQPEKKFSQFNYLHFIPFISFLIALSPKFFISTEELLQFLQEVEINTPFYIQFFAMLGNLSGFVYVPWCLIVLHRHQKCIRNNFSYMEEINLIWLRNVILGMAMIWVSILVAGAIKLNWSQSDFDPSTLIFIMVTVFIFIIGYYGSRQGVIFTDNRNSQEKEVSDKKKYEKSSLKEEQSEKYLNDLMIYMKDEMPYLESKITLRDLASTLGYSHNYLSQIINEKLNQNFYEFINQYRVEEFKKRVNEDKFKKLTLLGHAYESGFSSKSAFNEVFKKIAGITPSQYYKEMTKAKEST